MRRLLVTCGVVVMACAGCSDDVPDVSPQLGDGADAVELGGRDDTRPAPAGDGTDPPAGGADGVSPDPDGADGVETVVVDQVGEVDVRVTGASQMELVDVRPAAGWRYTVDDADTDEIELEFRHEGGRSVDVEITVEDGHLRTEVD